MTLKQFEKILDQKLIEGLGLLGFFAGEKNTYQKYFDNDKSGLILIEKTDRRTRNTWFIAPKVLFVHDSIELFAQELAKEFYTPNHIINTISEGLGYLTPQTEYLTWSFTVGEKEDMTMKTLYSLFQTIEKYAIPKIEQLCKDEELLEVMKNNELGIQITNHIKAPILPYNGG